MSPAGEGLTSPESFADALRRRRVLAGLTQAELAERARLSERTISNLERGINITPYPNTVRLLVEALGLTGSARAELTGAARPAEGPPSVRPAAPVGGFLGATPSGRLVAREAEWATLSEAVAATAAGEGRAVLLAGEPGIGKTRLAQEATQEAAERDFVVASGRCYASRSGAPFAPFLDVLATMYAAAPESVRDGIMTRWPLVRTLLPDDFPTAALPVRSTPDVAERLHRAVAGFVRALAAVRPVAILLDDVHWADGASVELLAHLARHTRGDRVLIVATYRTADLGSDTSVLDLARSLRREGIVATVSVGRLARDATAQLIVARLDGSLVSEEFAELIHGQSDGNPFFIVEILAALIERGDLSRIHGQWVRRELVALAAPASVSEAIAERVSRLSLPTQQVLEAVSVLGEVFDLDDLEAHDDLDAALDEAVVAGLLTEAAGRYTFDHGLTQQSVYASIAPARRRRLHRRAAARLKGRTVTDRSRGTAEIARHLEAAGEPGKAVPYLLLAGDEADSLHSPGDALRHYRRGLRLAEQLADEDSVAQAHERLGNALLRTSRHDESQDHLARAAAGYALVGDLPSRLRTEAAIAEAFFRLGAGEVAASRLDGILEELAADGTGGHPPGLAALWGGLARVRLALNEHERCIQAAERAARLAREEGDLSVEASADALRGVALQHLDRHDEAVVCYERSLSLAMAAGVAGPQSEATLALQWTCTMAGALDRALELGASGLELTRRSGDIDAEAHHSADLGLTRFYLGDWPAAQELLEHSVELARAGEPSLFSGIPPVHLGLLRRAQGDLAAAATLYAEAAAAPDVDTFALAGYVEARRAELDLVLGRPEAALARLEPWLDKQPLTRIHDVLLLSTAAEACLELGLASRAEELATGAVQRAAVTHNELDRVDAVRIRSRALAVQRQYANARLGLEAALASAVDLPHPAAEARAQRDLARLAHAEGDGAEARRRYKAALQILDRLGAVHDVAIVSDELRALE